MKILLGFIPPVIKGVLSVICFLIGLGWVSYASIHAVVRAEGNEIRREVKDIREIDIKHIDRRFDTIEKLIKEGKNENR